MRITGTQYTVEKKADALELRNAGKVVDSWIFAGKTMDEMAEEIWNALKRKGVTVQKASLGEAIQTLFPGARKHGPLQ
jgi:hypothetical protein